jgi:hypothetical protein
MRSLEQALQDHELIVLRVIGEWWELDLTGADKETCVRALIEKLTLLDMDKEVNYLPSEDADALSDLVSEGGRLPVAAFGREHGDVRMMGPGRLEREEPWLDPKSAAEALWYRGFLYRGFDETADGMIEFYYLPQELLARFSRTEDVQRVKETSVSAYEVIPAPGQYEESVTDAVDDLTTILVLAQRGLLAGVALDWSQHMLDPDPDRRSLLTTLARESGMLRETDQMLRVSRNAIAWLKQDRESQLRVLADAWSRSSWNDLCHVPDLACEGEGWQNDPILARTTLLDALPRSVDWFRISDVVHSIKQTDADFQRPDGNYDTWYIRDLTAGEYLTGFDSWELVEGRLIRFLLEGPSYWLGLTETAVEGSDRLYRFTPRTLDWLADKPPAQEKFEVPLIVQADGSILVSRNTGRYERFQAARVSDAEPITPGKPFHYRLTPHSLTHADEQGISSERILQFLEDAGGRPVPASVRRAVTRLTEKGVEVRMESVVVLRVRDAPILETLRNNPKTRDYIGESMGDLAVVVRQGDWQKLAAATTQLGLLLDVNVDF